MSDEFGRFEGDEPVTQWLDDGRQMKLLSTLAFWRPDGSHWPVPAGIVIDGASIPGALWSVLGGPFEGRYRKPSIVHDHYCVTKERPWADVHRMFYEGMRAAGVGPIKAKTMYYAVYRFGPRWPDPASFSEAGPEPARAFDPAGYEFDREAIEADNPDLDAIERLAEARRRDPARVSDPAGFAAEAAPDPAARARQLVVVGGKGDAADLAAVAAEAAALPGFVLARFEKRKIRLVACRESVTDFIAELRGVVPRGWEGLGKTWDDVPGTYLSDRKRVVIATIAAGAGRAVPTAASGKHGSANLTVHESLHGYDYSGDHAALTDPGFRAARTADFAHLGSYEQQAGQAGLEETYAETAARAVADAAKLSLDWPALANWWAAGPAQQAGLVEAAPPPEPAAPDAPIGTAEVTPAGIKLDLRAEGPGGAIGHAAFVIAPDAPEHGAVLRHLGGGAEAMPTNRPIPFRPMR